MQLVFAVLSVIHHRPVAGNVYTQGLQGVTEGQKDPI